MNLFQQRQGKIKYTFRKFSFLQNTNKSFVDTNTNNYKRNLCLCNFKLHHNKNLVFNLMRNMSNHVYCVQRTTFDYLAFDQMSVHQHVLAYIALSHVCTKENLYLIKSL
jgi:hypothetical protein